MSIQTALTTTPKQINGVNADYVMGVVGQISEDPGFAKMQFRVKNNWMEGGLNRSMIQGFYGAGREDATRTEPFVLDADEPEILASRDKAPNPVEYILHALAGCLTTTIVYHAAVRDIEIQAIESELEGDLDLRGIFGVSGDVKKGYEKVRVSMRVKSKATADELRELASYSPVYEMVSYALPVELSITAIS